MRIMPQEHNFGTKQPKRECSSVRVVLFQMELGLQELSANSPWEVLRCQMEKQARKGQKALQLTMKAEEPESLSWDCWLCPFGCLERPRGQAALQGRQWQYFQKSWSDAPPWCLQRGRHLANNCRRGWNATKFTKHFTDAALWVGQH